MTGGCYCKNGSTIGENEEGMEVCFGCGLVFQMKSLSEYDETINYDENSTKVSRCNGFSQKSYLSQNMSNTIDSSGYFSKFITNSLMWSNINHYDVVILKMKSFLEQQSYTYGFTSGKIEEFLIQYRNFLDMRETKGDANFKGKYLKGILAVFAFVIFKPITREKCCELFEIEGDIPTFNKCCKYYKILFNKDVNITSETKTELIDDILNNLSLQTKVKVLVKKGYNVCKQYNVLQEIYKKKTVIYIILFFLNELEIDINILEDYMKFINTTECKISLQKLQSIKYQIFSEIKKK